jgi:hypothetical protein
MKLSDIAKLIRSKNAGPFMLTFDVMFGNAADFDLVKESDAINLVLISELYNCDIGDIAIEFFRAANSIKISIPRPTISGSLEDSDVFGGQQYGPLVNVDITYERRA